MTVFTVKLMHKLKQVAKANLNDMSDNLCNFIIMLVCWIFGIVYNIFFIKEQIK